MNTPNWSKITGNFGKFLFKIRGYTPYPIVLIFILFAHPTGTSFSIGILLIIAGEFLRIWSVAYAGRETRERTILASRLVTRGPYAYLRNPIYLGNLIIYTGVTIMADLWMPYFLFFVWGYFGLQYYFIEAAEAQSLQILFGNEYKTYQNDVPAWLPFLRWTRSKNLFPPDFAAALRSEKSTFLSIAGVIILLYLKI